LPTAIKEDKGTARADRQLTNEMPIIALAEVPLPPAQFQDDRVKGMWLDVCNMLVPLGLLDLVGIRQIEMYCDAYQEYLSCQDHIVETGVTTLLSDKKYKPPVFTIRDNAFTRMQRIGASFGFDPSSKTKIGIGDARSPKQNMKVSLR